ncbi:uncharacterized protein LOC126232686 [Schistocerca nitens]|uniref:uncharacterized protein LOC126232686 n=1 Tax=Schistocerca nitens TaxID=7011 RepID=UPI0021193E7A|nr:uncharacterized protein LOC126232686 [Schistocerca nitens]
MVEMVKEISEFQTKDDFMKWKSEEERKTKSSFVSSYGTKRLKDGTAKTTFVCHRSGTFSSKSGGKRLCKSQGTCKMGNHCVAAIELHEEESGICSVIYYRTHFGHDQNIAFLHLSGSDRESIAGKIAEGVTFQRILDDVRDSVHSSGVERLHLLTRHDLHNIKRDFAIGDDQQHNIDEVSVGMWLEKMKDCVLLYKKEGEAREDFDRTDSVIVLMTDYQKQLLQRFGQNIVCVDSTHCTNVYKLLVTTLLVVDDFGSGMPVAFCVSNRETTSIMTHFFSAVKERAGIIKTSVFMSDDTNTFRSAWSRVMGPAENNLLCAWHIDRSWRNNLKKVHGNEEKKALVYKALRTLLEEVDIDNFNELLESFVGQLQADEGTRDFGVYFSSNYLFRPQQWAYCHRRNLGINTNMHLEAMHRVLKYCYLEGKTNNRLDRLLVVLMKLVRDKLCARMVKLYKGGHSYRINLIEARHKASCSIKENDITVNTDGTKFHVKSQTHCGVTHTVILNNIECKLECKLKCSKCNICIHAFSCSCADSLIHLNICKHIHAVSMTYALHSSATFTPSEATVTEEASAILCSLQTNTDDHENTSLARELVSTYQILINRVSSGKVSTEILKSLQKDAAHSLSLFQSDCREASRPPSNEKVKVQRRHGKCNKQPKGNLKKPTLAEKENIVSALRQPESEILNVHSRKLMSAELVWHEFEAPYHMIYTYFSTYVSNVRILLQNGHYVARILRAIEVIIDSETPEIV